MPIGVLEFEELSDVSLNAGVSKKLSLSTKNSGFNFLNDCKLTVSGQYSSWISSSDVKNLAGGESYDFVFELVVPEDAMEGDYELSLNVVCSEKTESSKLGVSVIEKKLEFVLLDAERADDSNVKVRYSLKEGASIDQTVEIQFLLYDEKNEKIAEFVETKSIVADSENEFESLIPIDDSVEGVSSLLVNLNSEVYSTFVQENIVIGPSISGLAIFSRNTVTSYALSLSFIFLFFVFAVFMLVKILRLRKKVHRKSGVHGKFLSKLHVINLKKK